MTSVHRFTLADVHQFAMLEKDIETAKEELRANLQIEGAEKSVASALLLRDSFLDAAYAVQRRAEWYKHHECDQGYIDASGRYAEWARGEAETALEKAKNRRDSKKV